LGAQLQAHEEWREAASGHEAGSGEIVLSVDAEVTQRNCSGWSYVQRSFLQRAQCSQPSEVGAESSGRNEAEKWGEDYYVQAMAVNKKMQNFALSIRNPTHLLRNLRGSTLATAKARSATMSQC